MAPKRPAVGALGATKNKMKQGSLFSFFKKADSKKPTNKAAAAPAAASKPAAAAAPSLKKKSNPSAVVNKQQLVDVAVGARIEVYWPDDEEYYAATVTKRRDLSSNSFYLEYDDGQCEWIDLSTQQYRTVVVNNKDGGSNKRRRIQQNDDDDDDESQEAEFDMDDASEDGSAYVQDKANNAEEDDDDDDQWMVTDDEDDQEISNKTKKLTKKKKSVKVIEHQSKSTTLGKTPARATTSASSTAATGSARRSTPQHVTPAIRSAKSSNLDRFQWSQSQQQSSTATATPTSSLKSPQMMVPTQQSVQSTASSQQQQQHTQTTVTTTKTITEPAMYTKGVVNPAGSHVHNHLKYLRNPRDAAGRVPTDPDYDPRTLKIVHSDWERHVGKMTDAVKQWWELKAQYADTVLFFKTGKFYELFHMDADAGVLSAGLSYMKGHVAHAGFPEIAYGANADKLVNAGYKVARVEQTETPLQLKERKKKHKGKGAPKVVNREVCSILTLGTRTFCYLDQSKDVLQEETVAKSAAGPLLAIREVLLDETMSQSSNEDGADDSVQPVCEYGVTLIDAVRGTVTIGQFADDVLRSRMNTLVATFAPSEILLEGGEHGASPTLHSLVLSLQTTSANVFRVETIRTEECFPKSTALDKNVRDQLQRGERSGKVHPWEVEETLKELHRSKYYPRASRQQEDQSSVSRWPQVLRAAVEGKAELALSSFGAALFYLQRNLIAGEILSMGVVKAYVPPESSVSACDSAVGMSQLAAQQNRIDSGLEAGSMQQSQAGAERAPVDFTQPELLNTEDEINHMSLDGTTLHNLEILTNAVDHKVAGSLWSKINWTKTPHGARLLRAWLLRPLFRKAEIERRADAVQELVSGGAAVALSEATAVLAKCGDIERLLSRVHSMSGNTLLGADDDENSQIHPNDRAVLYETATYTKRKVEDFSKLLKGLRSAAQIPELFNGIDIQSGLLCKIVRHAEQGGCFPAMEAELDWFFEHFDTEKAKKGLFEPVEGVDPIYDDACEEIARIQSELHDYKQDMCSNVLKPKAHASSAWKYINTKPESKDKYLIELPASIAVPDDFILKAKRGSGLKQINKYRTLDVERLVQELERAFDIQKEGKARGMQIIFSKFDSMRTVWAAAAQTTSILDAVGSLAHTASKAGFVRPTILDCPPDGAPSIRVVQGRHPCVENSVSSTEFVPNDLSLGAETTTGTASRVLLLSGPNMGGKSTLLRQTCLITIMAQLGSFVPAEECELTPVDRIFTRLGASDRILLGQSTFFVELAETAAALRGASRRSLVIMDELGRGTSTFDGTAIASAAVKHLVDRSRCVALFATHYHSLLEEWKDAPNVRLGHMECIVENGNVTSRSADQDESTITFLYTLGEGVCPRSFGINVARLAGLPEDVLSNAKRISSEFEEEMNGTAHRVVTARSAPSQRDQIVNAIKAGDVVEASRLWDTLNGM